MGDTMLHGVLRMPPNCWSGTELDVTQRHSRYIQASERIYELEDKLAQVERERDSAKARLEEAVNHVKALTEGVEHYNQSHGSMNKSLKAYCDAKTFLANQNTDKE